IATVAAVALALSGAERRWESKTREVRKRLETASAVRVSEYSEADLDALPPIVQRYFRAVLTEGQPVITHARVTSRGTMNMGDPPREAWKPFTAVQDFYPGAPGFVWNARVRMAPGLNVFVRDAFAGGQGSMFGSILGVRTVVDSHDTAEMAESSLIR